MKTRSSFVRLAARAIILHDDKLLLVNAFKGRDDLWCAPGGGAEPHQSLPENLAREVFEETGLTVDVGAPCLVNEFHDPNGTFHQVEMFFRCTLMAGTLDPAWQDPEKIVTHRRWVSRNELAALTVRPKSLAGVAWGDTGALVYDPLEPILP
jgi:8-oxo-dGTP diphosphatase